jgi:flagellar hook assembly protein FlgD
LPEAGDVRLEVYNMLGQVVTTLVDKQQAAGRYVHLWQGTNDNGNSVGSGIYFYRIQVGGEFQSVRKMLLLK